MGDLDLVFGCCFPQGLIHIFFYLQVRRIFEAITREREDSTYPSMITKCMLRVGSSMTSNEANLASGHGACSEFSDSSSSVSTDELPPTFGLASNRAGGISSGGGLLALVTTAPATTTNGFGSRSRLLHIGGGVSSTSDSGNLFSNDTTMISLMEASDCDDFTGKLISGPY